MGERMDEAKGNIKEGIGKLTGDTEMQAEGRTERDTAKAKREVKGAANEVKGIYFAGQSGKDLSGQSDRRR